VADATCAADIRESSGGEPLAARSSDIAAISLATSRCRRWDRS
jgi:hypothetical protein